MHNDTLRRREHLVVLGRFQISDSQRLAEFQVRDVYDDFLRHPQRQGANTHFAAQQFLHAALFAHAKRRSNGFDRHQHFDRFFEIDAQNIHVQQMTLHRVHLPIRGHRGGCLAARHLYRQYLVVPGGGLQNAGDLFGVDRERDGLLSQTVHHRRQPASEPQAAGLVLSALWPRQDFEFNLLLHCYGFLCSLAPLVLSRPPDFRIAFPTRKTG